MDGPLAELAAYFRSRAAVPGQELIRLTAAARAGGSRWDAIAAACRVRDDRDITEVISPAMVGGHRHRGGAAVRCRPELPCTS